MALYLLEKREDGSTLGIWEITETEKQLCDICSLSHEEREELSRMGSEKRRKERIVVTALLQTMWGEPVLAGHHPNGRPFLLNRSEELSIAHTHRFAVVLTHPQKRVGVDIESLERNFSAVEKKALSREEQESLSRESRSLQLAILWSAKEALYKCVSQENVDFATQIKIEPFDPQESGILCARLFIKDQSNATFFLKYKTIDNHMLVYTVE